jgi:hypothetical protein
MKNEWAMIEPEQFDPATRAYPFPDGEVAPGITIDSHQSVVFVGQMGPVNEVGVNGCQIDDMIKFARRTIEVFNRKFPCRENSIVITKLQEAEMWLEERKTQRSQRGVEGYNKP